MTVTRTKPAMHTFIVNVGRADIGQLRTLNANRIEAAYFKTEGDFTTFKDGDNQAVYCVRNDHLVSVERVVLCHDGATEPS